MYSIASGELMYVAVGLVVSQIITKTIMIEDCSS